MGSSVFETNDLSFCYGSTKALNNISTNVKLNEGIVVLLGRNGSGKSTLLRLMAGCIKPTNGNLRIDPSPQYVQYIGQYPVILPHLTARENAQFFKKIAHWRDRYSDKIFEETTNELNISEVLDQDGLSGGERRLIELLRAVTVKPEVLLLDEPFGSLDIDRRKHVYNFLVQYCHREGCVAVVATHMPLEVVPHSNLVIGLIGPKPTEHIELYDKEGTNSPPPSTEMQKLITGETTAADRITEARYE